MTPGPGDSATWRQPSARVTPRYDDSVDTLVEDALCPRWTTSRNSSTAQRPRYRYEHGRRTERQISKGAQGTHRELAAIRYYNDIEQGGEEWLAVRRGIPTASEMRLILTPTMRRGRRATTKSAPTC